MARADDEDMECRDEDKVRNDSDLDFIDEETSFQDQEPSDCRLKNVIKSLQKALGDTSMKEYYACSDSENYVLSFADDIKYDYDDFRCAEGRTKKFKKTPRIYEEGSKDSFFNTILFRLYFKLNDDTKKDFV